MFRVLLAGGRAPAALDLARAFHAAGHEVFVAETTTWCVCAVSRFVTRIHNVPWPTRDPGGYIEALLDIVRRERIDLLVPTFEEVFHIAKARERFAGQCEVLTDEIGKLHRLHNKWEFHRLLQKRGLRSPETTLLGAPEDLQAVMDAGRDVVLKPVYSRFSSRAVSRPKTPQDLTTVKPSKSEPWIAQEYIAGRQLCTYSIAHQGRLTAHAVYPTEFSTGLGTVICFRHIDHPGVFAWVESFVRREGFHGQIAFDFIETDSGELLPIECNPRTTAGVHLFDHDPRLARALVEGASELLTPRGDSSSMYALPMLAFYRAQNAEEQAQWKAAFSASREVTFDNTDPLPLLMQFLGLGWLLFRALRYRVPLRESGTIDLQWNGE